MKKFFVIIVLFALPIVAYLFFASGVHNFAKLPTLTPQIQDLDAFSTAEEDSLSFQDHISILGFYGEDPQKYGGHAFNLAGKIYDHYYKYKDFQLLIAVPEGTEAQVQKLEQELAKLTNPLKWKFIYGSPEDIRSLFRSLETDLELQPDLSTPYVFISDKKGALRGRDEDEDEGLLYGYDTRSVATLDDKMNDDVKVILAEYRLALKKYNKEKEQ